MATKTKTVTKKTEKIVKKELKLTDMTAGELNVLIKDLWIKIGKSKIESKSGKNKNTRQAFTLRKQLARAKTQLNVKI